MNHDSHRLRPALARRLNRLRRTPTSVLADIVQRDGLCFWAFAADLPVVAGEELSDRELAARLCAGCPVLDECLELELRTAGEHTTGVWGGLPADDRRALLPHWRQDREGGPAL